MFYDSTKAKIRKSRIREFIAQQLGVAFNKIPQNINELDVLKLGGDSLDVVELFMELEEEFDIDIPDEVAEGFQTIGDAIRYIQNQRRVTGG